jgi:hypothetical protein
MPTATPMMTAMTVAMVTSWMVWAAAVAIMPFTSRPSMARPRSICPMNTFRTPASQ